MTKLTPVSPSDLKVGEKYYIEVELKQINSNDTVVPYLVFDSSRVSSWIGRVSFFTPSSEPDNEELKMLVEVANDIFCASNNPKYTVEDAAVDAYNLIAACKKIKEGER